MATIIDIKKPSQDPIFQAEWPKDLDPALESTCRKTTRFFLNAISVILFPIGLARLLYYHVQNLAYRAAVPGQIYIDSRIESIWDLVKLAARFIFNPEICKDDLTEWGKQIIKDANGEPLTFKTPDGAQIDGAFFKGEKYPEKALIFIGGNAEQWESGRWLDLFKKLGISILTMNPRGVGNSTGSRLNGYHLDAYSACEWLLNKGFNLENIVFCGFSMGGAITALGAAETQKKYPNKKVNAININSFSSLQNEIGEIAKRVHWPISFFMKYGSRMFGIEMDAKRAWDAIKGEKYIFYNKYDPVVHFPAQMANAVEKKPASLNHLVELNPRLDHIPFNSTDEVNALYNAVCTILNIEGNRSFAERLLKPFSKSPSPLKHRVLGIIPT